MVVAGQLKDAQYESVTTLPSLKPKGRFVYLTTDDTVYQSDGSNWIPQISGANITNIINSFPAFAAFMPQVGEYKHTSSGTLLNGWIWASGKTIGNVSSNATERANADCLALFTEYFNSYTDAILPIKTSAGVLTTRIAETDAATAWAANCQITIPDGRNSTLIGKGDMGGTDRAKVTTAISGIDGKTLGASGGDEKLASHPHADTIDVYNSTSGGASLHITTDTQPVIEMTWSAGGGGSGPRNVGAGDSGGAGSGWSFGPGIDNLEALFYAASHHHAVYKQGGVTPYSGGSSANMPPSLVCNIMIKL